MPSPQACSSCPQVAQVRKDLGSVLRLFTQRAAGEAHPIDLDVNLPPAGHRRREIARLGSSARGCLLRQRQQFRGEIASLVHMDALHEGRHTECEWDAIQHMGDSSSSAHRSSLPQPRGAALTCASWSLPTPDSDVRDAGA